MRQIRLIEENILDTNNMSRKRVKNCLKHFEGKNFYQKVPNFYVVCRIQCENLHFLAKVLPSKCFLKIFDTFSSHVIGI